MNSINIYVTVYNNFVGVQQAMQKYPNEISSAKRSISKLSTIQPNPNCRSKSQVKSSSNNNDEVPYAEDYVGKYCKVIEQIPIQQHVAPSALPNSHKNRSLSYDEIGVGQCKIFETKVRMKRNNSRNEKDKPCCYQNKCEHTSQEEKEQKESISFAEQYRINLRKTVFNETKMMIKYKKNKEKQHSIQTLSNYRPNQTMIAEEHPPRVVPAKSSLHNFRSRHGSQKISTNLESIYKSTLDSSCNQHPKHLMRAYIDVPSSCCDLDIAKFPLILRGRDNRPEEQNTNYSNLLTALNMRQTMLKQLQHVGKQKPRKRFSKIGFNRGSSRGSTLEKHEIKPWETYADQFTD